MKKFFMFLVLSIFCFAQGLNYAPKVEGEIEELPMVIVIPSFNNKKYCLKNLKSVFSQNYSNYRVIYTNDASTDNTGELVQRFVEENGLEEKFTYIENKENQGACYNFYKMIHLCKPYEIVCVLDGDDWLYHNEVLQRVNRAYADPDVWVTYGSDKNLYTRRPHSLPTKKVVLRKGTHRKISWRFSHLRTFYAGLFQMVPKEKWMKEGKFYAAAPDFIQMYYMIDLAREHTYFIPELLYFYNTHNPRNEFRTRLKEQQRNARYMRSLKSLERVQTREEFLLGGNK